MRRPVDLEATTQLSLGDRGQYEGEGFELVGRRCIQGVRGQVWNEWVLASPHDPPIVLSESWGSFTIFRPGSLMPGLEALHVGADLSPPWVVVERGRAKPIASWGDADDTEQDYPYADLSFVGTAARRGSISEDETFLGEPVDDVHALGLAPRDAVPALIPAPNLSLPSGIELWLDIGDLGSIEDVEYRVLGIVARHGAAIGDDDAASWEEYLVHNARVGLRWLSVADGHWSFASPIEAGAVAYEWGLRAHDDRLHVASPLLSEDAASGRPTRLRWIAGALPWSAEVGEIVSVTERDEIALEWTREDLSAARVQDLEPDEVARAFGKRSLPRPKSPRPASSPPRNLTSDLMEKVLGKRSLPRPK